MRAPAVRIRWATPNTHSTKTGSIKQQIFLLGLDRKFWRAADTSTNIFDQKISDLIFARKKRVQDVKWLEPWWETAL